MKKIHILITAGITMFITAVSAQAQAHGYLMSRYRSYTDELPLLSTLNNGFGTARSAAMGGAYVSLGADLSSIGINPAGLGMYRSSEFGITPNISVSNHKNSGPLVAYGKGDSKTSFLLNNTGIAMNMGEGRNGTNFTLGFTYNRMADFNYKSSVMLNTDKLSITEIFAYQLRGIHENDLKLNSRPTPWANIDIYPDEWGAALAYRTWLVGAFATPEDPGWGSDYDYRTYYPKAVDLYGMDRYADVNHTMRVNSSGGIGEYNFAGGLSLNDNVYLGFGIGIQDIYRKQSVTYNETYSNNEGAADPANGMTYTQHTRISGTGVNFKFGVIANPVKGLRLGLTFHTPTWNSIEKRYSAEMGSVFPGSGPGTSASFYSDRTDTWEYDYRFSTYGRLAAGASYTFGNLGLISVDYECDFYNWMRLRVPSGERYFQDDFGTVHDEFKIHKQTIKDSYKPRHTVRIGGEIKATPALALRGGFAYQGSFLENDKAVFNEPMPYKTMNISTGLGYRFNNVFSLDLAYVFMKTDYSGYDLFYYNGPTNMIGETAVIDYGNVIDSKLENHNIIVSFNVRF